MKLLTKRLHIRPITTMDYNDLCDYGCDEETGKYMMYWPKTKEEIIHFLETSTKAMNAEKPNWYEFAVELKAETKMIGNITLIIKKEYIEIGWISNKNYWNKGYMTEAVREILDYAFRVLEPSQIIATCTAKNIGSYRVMEKCGMQRIKEEPHQVCLIRGQQVVYDKLTYAITSPKGIVWE